MKKTIFLISFIALAVVTMAQKNSWYAGGMVGYAISNDKPESDDGVKITEATWNANPEFGTFITNTLQIGFVGGVSGYVRKYDEEKDYSSFSVSPTVYLSNFYKFTDNLSGFARIYVNYFNGKDIEYDNTDPDEIDEIQTTHMGFGSRLGIGIAYALSPRFTVLGQYGLVGFSTVAYEDDQGNKTNTDVDFDFGVNTVGSGTAFNVGIYYTFVKGK
jgi:hypothetical protein